VLLLPQRKRSKKPGSFNPHLAVEEEAELGLRLIKHGWKLQIIPLPMACHTRCYHMQTMESVISIFKRDIVTKRLGRTDENNRLAFKEGYGLAFCWLRLKTTIVFFGWLLLLLGCWFLPEFLYPKTVFLSITVLGILAIFGKKRSLRQTLLFIPAKILNFIDILAGFYKIRIKSAGFYPLDVIEHEPKFTK
jgi:GT2 family glycosyltransferase